MLFYHNTIAGSNVIDAGDENYMGIEKPNLNFRIRERLRMISARMNTAKYMGSMLELFFVDFAIHI